MVPSAKAEKYQTKDSLKDLSFAVEAGSAGETAAKDAGLNYTSLGAQSDALMEVEAGTSDAWLQLSRFCSYTHLCKGILKKELCWVRSKDDLIGTVWKWFRADSFDR